MKAILGAVASHTESAEGDGLDLLGGGGGGGGGSVAKALLKMQMPNTAGRDVDDFPPKKGQSAARLWLDVPGAHIIRNLLKCPPVPPRQCKRVVESVLALDSGRGEMVALAKDSVGARCVVEPLIMLVENNKEAGGDAKTVTTFEWARDRLHEMLVGSGSSRGKKDSSSSTSHNIGAVAGGSASGFWCVVRLFDHGTLPQKTRIVEQLHEHQTKLVSTGKSCKRSFKTTRTMSE